MVTTFERQTGTGVRDTASAIVVGTRIYTGLYNRGEGIVYAVKDEPPMKAIPGVRILNPSPHRKQFDIVFLHGARSQNLPEAILRGVQWRILDKPVAEAAEIQAALAIAHHVETEAQAAAAAAEGARTAELERLRTAPEYAHLAQGDDRYSGKLAGANIRKSLKAAFPGVAFSVKKSSHGSLSVSWTDGPTVRAVEAITSIYRRGSFDGMQDMYQDDRSAWCEVYGGVQYINAHRETTPALVDKAIAAVFAAYPGNLVGFEIPTAEDFRQGRTYRIEVPHLGEPMERFIREQLSNLEG
jgi:hypothetical protein